MGLEVKFPKTVTRQKQLVLSVMLQVFKHNVTEADVVKNLKKELS